MNTARELKVLMPLEGGGLAESGPGLLERAKGTLGRERLVFPALAADPAGLAGVLLTCLGEPGRITVNGREAEPLWKKGGRVLLPAELFRRWENVVSVRCDARGLLLAPVVDSYRAVKGLDLPSESRWRVETLPGESLGEVDRPRTGPGPATSAVRELARGLAAMIAPSGDVWSFYDLTDQTFRLPGWRWDTGIVLEALAACAGHSGDGGLLDAALAVGERLAAVQVNSIECPGGFPEWTDLRYTESPRAVSQWVVPFNAAFIGAGLIRLSEASGRPAYARAARRGLRLAAGRGMTRAGGVSGYYFEQSRQWRYLGQINDSGVLGRGLAFLPEEAWAAEAAVRAGGYVLDKAAHLDGHVGRAWWDPAGAAQIGEPLFPEWRRDPDRVVPKVFLRGQAWVLLGLTGAVRLRAGGKASLGAHRLAQFILKSQLSDGSWLYSGLQPRLGSCAKTTAALALALAEWSYAAGEPSALPAVRRALGYLEACRRPDVVPPELAGLPVDSSEEGCIIYFRNRPVICAYAGALELLARLAMGEGA